VTFLIDTNIAIHARDGNEVVLDRLRGRAGDVLLSALSLVELQRGLYRDESLMVIRRRRLERLLRTLPVLPFDAIAAEAYGDILAQCGWGRGRDFDRMIAAHALSRGYTLVTDNLADFRDIPGQALEDWTVPP
jgi:tRNA(fMet)-specific endonuclease VapC